MAITAAMVKDLREATGLGMMDCKKALEAAGGDIELAKEDLRKKGMVAAEKKAGRETSEGLVGIKVEGNSVAMAQILCETDFCSRNDEFKNMVADMTDLVFQAEEGNVEATEQMTERLQETLAKIGENMSYSKGIKIVADKIGTYLHHNGKVGVVVGIMGDCDEETLTGLCQHIAFADPMGITAEDVPAELVAKEREIAIHQAVESGKPQEIAEKMVEGKIRKFVAERSLLEQNFIKDDKKKVKDVLGGATVKAFARFAVGG